MLKKILILFISVLFLIFIPPAYSKDYPNIAVENYINKISKKFSRTYCNTIQFGISNDGALAFAIGETNKEFKNNKLNDLIDYSLLTNNIVNTLEDTCQFYDFPLTKLDDLKIE